MKLRVFDPTVVCVAAILLIVGNCGYCTGWITGYGRFEKIAGNPGMGYKELYEWDLFLSPADNSMVGPSRRLGAPPGEPARGDGYYRIDNLPAGEYSVYVNQPDFFASPKVVPNVQINNDQQTTLNVELDVDYSTYFSSEWTDWGPWTWYQTFKATGTSVRGVSWRMAGWGLYSGKTARVAILEDNGMPDVSTWPEVGSGSDGQLSSDSDEWVRWPSGEINLVPEQMYAVSIHIDGGLAIYRRNKDGQSYPHGSAYNQDGNPQNFDLNVTVFVDKNDQLVTHSRLFPGAGDLASSATRWGQTFEATGGSLAAVDLFAASGMAETELTWTIHQGGPGGAQIGPTKKTQGAYFASSTDLIGVSYNPGDVQLTPGQMYYIEAYAPGSFTAYTQPSWNTYSDGSAYKNSSAVVPEKDLAMTIMEYAQYQEPRSIDLNGNNWIEFWDFAMLAPQWGQSGDDLSADFDHSGVVDALDLEALFYVWLVDFRLTAHWKLDEEGGEIAHDSIRANDGTVHGDPQWLPSGGELGGALEMDGTDDYVNTDFVLNPGDGPFSVFAWIKAGGAEEVVLSQTDSGENDRSWLAADSAGNLMTYLIRPGRGSQPLISEVTITDGHWHRIGLVCDGSYRRLYSDGVEVAADSLAVAGIIGADGGLHIGADSVLSAGSFWTGLIDDVRIYDQAVTP